MHGPQRFSTFVANQVSRREFLRRSSSTALGVALAVPTLGHKRRTTGISTILQRVPSGTQRVLSASEIAALGLPLYLPNNEFPSGPDCPCDCSRGCQWRDVGSCTGQCGGACGACDGGWPWSCGSRNNCDWLQCFDCCNDVCGEQCTSCWCGPCCC